MKISTIEAGLFALCAVCAGTLNGLIGTGGGIVTVFALKRFLRNGDYSVKDVFVTSMLAIIPISIISLSTYPANEIPTLNTLLSVMIPAGIGGFTGAVLSHKIKSVILEKAFAVLIIYAGVKMILR